MKNTLLISLAILFLAGCKNNDDQAPPPPPEPTEFIKAADVSFLPEIEQYGTVYYYSDGTPADVLAILKANGCNTIRIRLWYEPETAHSGLAEVAAFAARIKSAGMKVWLNLHYSDTWADPGKQYTPDDWRSLSYAVLKDSVYAYTKRVLDIIHPEFVQIGNEVNSGMLWEKGRIDNPSDFTGLLKMGIKAARDHDPSMKIIIHFAGLEDSGWFFDLLTTGLVDYDIMALSYYPTWHGKDLQELRNVMADLVAVHDKEIVIAETAYPFTLGWNDYTNNIIGLEEQLIPGYDATPEGQAKFLRDLIQIVRDVEGGVGFCYWSAEWVAFKGSTASDGSPWENQAFFDFDNKALPVLEEYLDPLGIHK